MKAAFISAIGFCCLLCASAWAGEVLDKQEDTKTPFLDEPLGKERKGVGDYSIQAVKSGEGSRIMLLKDGAEAGALELPRSFRAYSVVAYDGGFWFVLRKDSVRGIAGVCIVQMDSEKKESFFPIMINEAELAKVFRIEEVGKEGLTVTATAARDETRTKIKYVKGVLAYEKMKRLDPEESKIFEVSGDEPEVTYPLNRVPRQ